MFKRYQYSVWVWLSMVLCPVMAGAVDSIKEYTFEQAIQQALKHNHDVKLSQLSLQGAQAAIQVAKQSPNPFLTLQTAGINPKLGVGSGSLRSKTVDTTIRVDQLIERGGKKGLRVENAIQLEQAAKHDWMDTQRQVYLNVAQAYYDLLAAQEQLKISRETVALFQCTMRAALKRKKAGDLAGADIARLTVDGLRAENDARQAQADWIKAQQNLVYLLGEDKGAMESLSKAPRPSASSTVRATDHWPAMESSPLMEVNAILLKRPDVVAAQKRVDAAQTALALVRAQRKRDVSVGLQFEHYPIGDANQQGSGNSYGVSVQIPILVNTNYEPDIQAAMIAKETAQENLEKTKNAARLEIQQAIADKEAAMEQVQRFQGALLKAAQQSSEAAEFAFKKGAIGVMDVLDARRVYRATQQEAITAQAHYAKAWEALRVALQFNLVKEY
jgi:outer membrane protein, heavy metal efflux system